MKATTRLGSFFLILMIGTAMMAGEPVPLFDGKTLAGWTSLDGGQPGAGWAVEDGVVHLRKGEPKGGYMLSEKEFTSFDLEWEWKIAEGGNNGIKYWVTKIGGKEWLGIEYQMIDDTKHPDGLKGGSHTTASIYDIKEPAKDKPLKSAGEWNTSRVVVKDGKIQHFLNGALVCEADTATDEWKERIAASKFKKKEGFAPGKGHIMITDHGDEVWIKNVRIKEL